MIRLINDDNDHDYDDEAGDLYSAVNAAMGAWETVETDVWQFQPLIGTCKKHFKLLEVGRSTQPQQYKDKAKNIIFRIFKFQWKACIQIMS